MARNRWTLLIVLVLVWGGLLPACGRKDASPSPPGRAPAPATPAPATPAPAAATPGTAVRRYAVVSGQSKASYLATEKFISRDLPSPAVGTTTAVEGTLTLGSGGRIEAVQVKADLRGLVSDDQRRDNRLRTRWLESDRYPWAEFALSETVAVPGDGGQPVQAQLMGELTVRGVRRPVAFDAAITREGDVLRLMARTAMKLTDFGIEPPDIAGMLKVNDDLKVEVDLIARPAP